jgi:outer membrane protein assembly complex protein YaeT
MPPTIIPCLQYLRQWSFMACFFFLLLSALGAEAKQKPDTVPKGKYALVFKNNQALSAAKLKKAAAFELKQFAGQGLRPSDIDDAAYQMVVAYNEAGYHFAEVDYKIHAENQVTTVIFEITEGPRVLINQIIFIGNKSAIGQDLPHFFENQNSGLLKRTEPVFVMSDVERALSEIKQYYIANGFLDIVLSKPVLEFSQHQASVSVKIFVSEGVQYIVREVLVDGGQMQVIAQPVAEIRETLVGQPYFRRKKVLLRSYIEDAIGNLGYPRAQVVVREMLNPEDGHVILRAAVSTGPLVTIEDIEVHGNKKTKTTFILNRLLLKPGDPYSIDKRRQSIRELFRTGLFSRVDIRLEPQENSANEKLLVEVVETKFAEAYFEPGWGSYEQLRFKAGLKHRNVLGSGFIINPELAVSTKSFSTTLRFTDPWLFNTDITADVPVYYNYREEPAFTRQDLGGAAFLSKRLSRHWTVTGGYSLLTTELSDVDLSEFVESSVTDYDLGSVTVQTTYDTRDDFFFPTQGKRLFLSAEHADEALGGSITFSRLTGGARFFYKVAPQTVVGLRYTSGLIIPQPRADAVPIGERFFNGGESTVRSFNESDLGPKDPSGNPIGGHGFNVINFELRQRLIGNFIGTVFIDAGNIAPNRLSIGDLQSSSDVLSETINDFFSGFRYGVGFGLQYLLPLGPLRADFAFNPDPDEQESEESFVFHFSIGAAF